MSAQGLSSRAIIGRFYETLNANTGAAWVDPISMLFESNMESETYKWLGMSPAMREWIGGRQAKGFRENGITIINKNFEATLEVLVDELRRDKTGQIMRRVDELAIRTNSHWASLLSTLIMAGDGTTAGLCYDGQSFFDTDHSEGDSGTQDNDLTANISAPTAPTADDMEEAILSMITAILGFKDDRGEPMNEDAMSFVVMTPTNMMAAALAAVRLPVITDGSAARTAVLPNTDFKIKPVTNPRLTDADTFYCFRADGRAKPFIRQEEQGVQIAAIAEGSELEFTEKKHHYGVSAIRNVGYGYWQHACQMVFT